MDEPNILRALAQCRVGGFRFNLMETSFIIGREKLRQRPRPHHKGLWRWRDALFILMANNRLDATEFFRIPANRVVELCGQIVSGGSCVPGRPEWGEPELYQETASRGWPGTR